MTFIQDLYNRALGLKVCPFLLFDIIVFESGTTGSRTCVRRLVESEARTAPSFSDSLTRAKAAITWRAPRRG